MHPLASISFKNWEQTVLFYNTMVPVKDNKLNKLGNVCLTVLLNLPEFDHYERLGISHLNSLVGYSHLEILPCLVIPHLVTLECM